MREPGLVEAGHVLGVAQIDLRLHHAVEARTGALETGDELVLDDVVGLEFDRPLPPERARMAHRGIERAFAVLARLPGLSRHEAEGAGAECGAVAWDRRDVVARLERLVPDRDAGAGNGCHYLDLDGLASA